MASISGLSSGGSLNSTSGLRGYGGLASGLDRDSMIESMTYATRSKIAAQKQKKEKISWTQEAMRGITGKLYEFSSKYTSYASSSNLLGSKLFSRDQITALGSNSNHVSVTGSSTSADTISILGVKSLAQDAQMTTNKEVSDQTLGTGYINNDLSKETWADMVSGETLFVKYGTKTYSVTLNADDKFKFDDSLSNANAPEDAAKQTVDLINRSLEKVSIGDGKTLANVMKAEIDPAGKKISFKNTETAGNDLKITGSTGDLLKDLGIIGKNENINLLPDSRLEIDKVNGLVGVDDAAVVEKQSVAKQLSEKQISFSYNGTVKWIKLDKYETTDDLVKVQEDIQKKLEEAFGKGRIAVGLQTDASDPNLKKLTFETTLPGKSAPDNKDTSSVLAITSGDRGVIGNNSIFHIKSGESNRLNLSTNISDSGLLRAPVGVDTDPSKIDDVVNGVKVNHMTITNDGVTVDLTEKYGLNWQSSLNEIMEKVNADEELGIKITYQSNADKFVVQSKEQGASGAIALGGNLADTLFGSASGTDYTVRDGKDAVIRVKYAGSGEEMDITRGSNTMTIDGLNVTVKSEFGFDGTGNYIAGTEAITFDAQVDADNTTKVVKEMVEAYNEALKLINAEVSQKPNRNYAPLTDEQREALSDSQIEKWETEAKKGLLFNDTDVRGLADGLRFIIPSSMRTEFEKMGISVSSNYADNGKLVFDETKFKAALQKDPDAVHFAFTAEQRVNSNGDIEQEAGLMVKMKNVMDKYASMTGATKGILVERSGSIYAPTSVLKNTMQKQMDEIDDIIDRLGDKLKIEQDRYISQFTRLESLISQMNSQSGYLNSMFSSQ